MDYKSAGTFISNLRKTEGLTQQAFAKKFHVTHQAVSKWENGIALPDTEVLISIADTYKIKVDDILKAKIAPSPDIKFEFGFGIIPYLDLKNKDNLLTRVSTLRSSLKAAYAADIPNVHFLDNCRLGDLEYRIGVNGTVLTDNHLDLVDEDDRIIEMLKNLEFDIQNHVINNNYSNNTQG